MMSIYLILSIIEGIFYLLWFFFFRGIFYLLWVLFFRAIFFFSSDSFFNKILRAFLKLQDSSWSDLFLPDFIKEWMLFIIDFIFDFFFCCFFCSLYFVRCCFYYFFLAVLFAIVFFLDWNGIPPAVFFLVLRRLEGSIIFKIIDKCLRWIMDYWYFPLPFMFFPLLPFVGIENSPTENSRWNYRQRRSLKRRGLRVACRLYSSSSNGNSSSSNDNLKRIDHLLSVLGEKGKLTSEELLVKNLLFSSHNLSLSLHSRQKQLLFLKSSLSGEPIDVDTLLKELETNPDKKKQLQKIQTSFSWLWEHEPLYVKRSKGVIGTHGSRRIVQTYRAYFPIIKDFLDCERKSVLLAYIIQKTFYDIFLYTFKNYHQRGLPFYFIAPEIGSTALDYIVNAAFKDYQKCSNDNSYITKKYLGKLIGNLVNIERGASSSDKILIQKQREYLRNLKTLKVLEEDLKILEERKKKKLSELEERLKKKRLNEFGQLKKNKSIVKLKNLILKLENSISAKKQQVISESSCNFVCDDIHTFRKRFSLIPCIQSSEAFFFGFLLIKAFEALGLITIIGGESSSKRRRTLITIHLSNTSDSFNFIKTAPISAITSNNSLPFICVDYLTLTKNKFWQYDNHLIGLPLITKSGKVLHISEDRIATIEKQVKQGFEICEKTLTILVLQHRFSFKTYIKSKKNSICTQFYWPDETSFTFESFVTLNKNVSSDLTLLKQAYKEYLLHEFFFYSVLKSCILFLNYRLYFPIFLDFRGRLYLHGSPLNPYGNKKLVRPLFKFPGEIPMFEVDIHAQGIQILSLLSVGRLGLNYTGLLPFRKNSVVIRNKDNNEPDLYSFFAAKWRLVLLKFISSKIFINSPENATSEDCLKSKRLANRDLALRALLIDFINKLTDRKIVKTLVMFGSYGESIYSQIQRLRKRNLKVWFYSSSRLSIAISKNSLTMPRKEDNSLILINSVYYLSRRFLDLFRTLQKKHLPEITLFIQNIKLLVSCITRLTGKKNSLNLSFDNSFTTTSAYDNTRKFLRSFTANIIHGIDGLIVDRVLKKIHVIKYEYSEKGIQIHFFTIHDAFYINPDHTHIIKEVYKEVLRELFADDFIEALLAANNLTYSDIAKESEPLADYFKKLAHKRKNFLRKNSF